MADKLCRGQVVIRFYIGQEPKVEFMGEVDPLDIQAGVYRLRQDYQLNYLQIKGEMLKKQIEANKQQKEQVDNAERNVETVVRGTNGATERPSPVASSGGQVGSILGKTLGESKTETSGDAKV